jgi:glycine hydroxymethyltransferase
LHRIENLGDPAVVVTPTQGARALETYLANTDPQHIDPGFTGYLASLSAVSAVAPEVARGIVAELADQRSHLKLIASENYSSLATQLAMGNLLTDKYAEGYPGHRFYEGCENVDLVESYACEQACTLFGAEHAYVQPHSGADANLIAFWAILQTRIEAPRLAELELKNVGAMEEADWEALRRAMGNQRLLGMDLYSGGHLTHGYRMNVSGKMFECHSYGVSEETMLLDYDALERQVMEVKPLILLAGYSAYPRAIDFRRMREIADKAGAVLMVDMAHFAGLVAGKVLEGDHDPVAHAHIVTSTTHKTLRGPRGGIVLAQKEFADSVDKGCPLVIGGPLPHVICAKGVAFTEANKPAFQVYAKEIVANAQALAQACIDEGLTIVSGGTDNHLALIDVTPFGLTGMQAAAAVHESGITLNKNTLPFDKNGAWFSSGLRVGTPAVTTLGMGEAEMKEIAAILKLIIASTKPATIQSGRNAGKPSRAKADTDPKAADEAARRVQALLEQYPVYPELDLTFLQQQFG